MNSDAVLCTLCGGSTARVGGALLDDTMLSKMSNHPLIGPMYGIARESFGYKEQFLEACERCGFVFLWPVLDDVATTYLMFKTMEGEWSRSMVWQTPELRVQPIEVWYSAVRIPSIERSLRPFLPTDRPLRVLDVGGHEGEISLNMALPAGSKVDITQLENGGAWLDPKTDGVAEVRTFNGLTSDLVESDPTYQADLVLAINVLEHTDNPNGFLQDCRKMMADDGLLVVEVPFEPWDGMDLAMNLNFQLVHNLYFFPDSFRFALERNGLIVEDLEVLPHAHTGVVPAPSTQMRAVCRKAGEQEGSRKQRNVRTPRGRQTPTEDSSRSGPELSDEARSSSFYRSIDTLIGSFGASLAFIGNVSFVVFVFDPRCYDLLEIFRSAPNFKGAVTTNEEIDYPNLFDCEIEADYLIILKPQDREQVRSLAGPFEII